MAIGIETRLSQWTPVDEVVERIWRLRGSVDVDGRMMVERPGVAVGDSFLAVASWFHGAVK